MAVSKAQQKAVAKYNSKAYDEIKVRVFKGSKEVISNYAEIYKQVNKWAFRGRNTTIKSEVQCDVYSDSQDMFMTSEQLGTCLEYSDPIRNINKVVSRNEYLKQPEFSTVVKLTTVDGKTAYWKKIEQNKKRFVRRNTQPIRRRKRFFIYRKHRQMYKKAWGCTPKIKKVL